MLDLLHIELSKAPCLSCAPTRASCICKHSSAVLELVSRDNSEDSVVLPTARTSPRPGFGCFREEQFAGIPGGSTAEVRSIVDFEIHIINPAHDFVTDVFDVTNIHAFYIPFLHNPLFYHVGLLLIGSVHKRLQSGAAYQSSSKLLQHRGRAMTRIREHLKNPDWQKTDQNEGLIPAILSLALFEKVTGHPENARQHLRGLMTIINTLGGLEYLLATSSFEQRALVTHFEGVFAMSQGWSIFERDVKRRKPSYPSVPIDAELQTSLKKLPLGFHSLVMEGKLCLHTIKILQRAVDFDMGGKDEAARRFRANRKNESRAYATFIEACPILLAADDTQSVLIDKMICLALLLFSTSISHTIDGNTSFFSMSKIVLESKMHRFQPCSNTEFECLVWLFLITIDSYRTSGLRGCTLKPGGLELLRSLRRKLPEVTHTYDWNDIEVILLRFFWTAELSRFWKKSWAELTRCPTLDVVHESGRRCSRES